MKKLYSFVLVTLFLVLCMSFKGNNIAQAQTITSTPTNILGAIVSIQPEKIFNNADRNVTILVASKSTPFLLSIGETPIELQSWTVQPSTGQIEIKITLKQDFPVGSYKIRIQMASGEIIESITPFLVVPKTNPQIDTIEPSTVLVYPSEAITFTIHGKDLTDVSSATLGGWASTCSKPDDLFCPLVSQTDTEIVYKLHIASPALQKVQSTSLGQLTMADDQKVQLPEIYVQDRVVPWNLISWVGFFAQVLMMMAVIIGSNRFFQSLLKGDVLSSRPEFSIWGVTLGVFIGIMLGIFVSIAAGTLSYFFSWSLTTLIVTTIMAAIISLSFIYLIVGFPYADGNDRRIFLLIGASLIIVGIGFPFWANSVNIQSWVGWCEAGILCATFIWGTLSLSYMLNQYPPDEEILRQIETVLYEKGQAILGKDLADLPRARTDRILQAYYEQNKEEEGLIYDKKQKAIYLETKIQEVQQQIFSILETQGLVRADEELKQHPQGLAKKALKRYFEKNKKQGDLEYSNGRLVLTGQVNKQLYTSIEQSIFKKGFVEKADFPGTGRARVITALSTYFTDHKAQYQLTYNEADATLELGRKDFIAKLNTSLEKLLSLLSASTSNSDQIDPAVYDLMVNIWLGFGFGEGEKHELQNLSPQLRVFNTTPGELTSILPNPFPMIVMLTKLSIGEEGIRKLKETLIQLAPKNRFSILISLNDTVTTRELVKQKLVVASQENIAVLNRLDLVHALAAPQELRLAFMELLQDQVDLSPFSPYRSAMPTESDMFFGRQDEIRTVVNSISERSVAILGARKIGKTSMLREVLRILSERGKLLLYLDCYHVGNYATFFSELHTRLDLVQDTGIPCKDLTDFPKMLGRLQELNPGRQAVFVFDEIDRLLKFDINQKKNSEALFRLFRSLAQEGRCQFIFSGERTILDQMSNPKSSFLNFTIPIKLGLLDNSAIKKLVTEPMQLMGIHISEPENVIAYIHKKTSGHPNLIQFLCDSCVTELSESERRILTRQIVEQKAKSNDYLSLYQQIFWSQSTPLEKALSVGVIENQGLTEGDALTYLKEIGFEVSITSLRRALEYLSLNQLLIKDGNIYQLQPSDFPESIANFTFEQWKQALFLESKQANQD